MRNVQSRSGQLRQLYVARDTNRFRGSGHARQSEPRGRNPFAHHRAGRERNVFGMLDHRDPERVAIIHHLARKLRSSDRFAVIAYGHDPGVTHRRNFGDRLTFTTDRRRTNRPDADAATSPRAIENKSRHARVVVHRLRIRHAAHRGEAALRRRTCASFDRLRIFLPGFAQVHVNVDKSRRDDQSTGIENFQPIGRRTATPGSFPGAAMA